MDFDLPNATDNAYLLLEGMWYSALPKLLEFSENKDLIIDFIKNDIIKSSYYSFNSNLLIDDFCNINNPPYIRKNGTEAITFYDFKKMVLCAKCKFLI